MLFICNLVFACLFIYLFTTIYGIQKQKPKDEMEKSHSISPMIRGARSLQRYLVGRALDLYILLRIDKDERLFSSFKSKADLGGIRGLGRTP